MERQPRQKSFSELANEQLNPGGARNRLAQGMEGAEKPDCLAPNQSGGLLAAPLIALNTLQGKCK